MSKFDVDQGNRDLEETCAAIRESEAKIAKSKQLLSKLQLRGAYREHIDHLSPRAYRLDDRKCADYAEESDKEEVTPHRRKTATKRSERRGDD